MNTLIFNFNDEFQLYYGCDIYNVDSMPLEKRSIANAVIYIALTLIFSSLYIPCIIVMCRQKYSSQPCYKLMLYLSCVNTFAMLWAGSLGAILIILGYNFCTSPAFIYSICCLGTCLWFVETTTTVLLAFNRCLTMRNSILSKKLFQGLGKHTIHIWLCIPTVVGLLAFLHVRPYLLNSVYGGYFKYPYLGYANITTVDPVYYQDQLNVIYNWAIAAILVAIYSIFFVFFLVANRVEPVREGVTVTVHKREFGVFVQIFAICLICVSTCIAYVYNGRLLQANPEMVIFVNIGYIAFQGSPAVIYLLLNKTIRSELIMQMKSVQITAFRRSSTHQRSEH